MVWPTKWLLLCCSFIFVSEGIFAEPTKAPHFPHKKIQIGKTTLNVEAAETEDQLSYGLMNRNKLTDQEGMIFIFQNEQPRAFWMKNTFIDLSIGYFSKDRTLIQILDMKATNLLQKDFPTYESSGPAQYALEVTKGWFAKKHIKVGDKFEWR